MWVCFCSVGVVGLDPVTTCALVCYIHVFSCIDMCGGYEHRVHVYQNDHCVRSPNKLCTPKLKGYIPQKLHTPKKVYTQMKSVYHKKVAYPNEKCIPK